MTESLKDKVRQAFTAYVKYASDFLRRTESTDPHTTKLRIAYIDPGSRLRSLVEKAEESNEFVTLADATGRAFVAENASDVESSRSECVLELQDFFRRSRFYLKAFSGKLTSPDDIFEQFWSAKSLRTVKTTTLRLMHGVTFESWCVDCGRDELRTLKIQRFTKHELDAFTERETNEIFYPAALLNTTEASEYWF